MKTAPISVTYIEHMGSDLSVVNAARVSFDKESDWDEEGYLDNRDAKLIKYLADHQHKSPFNHCFISFRIKAPIFVARQLVKHKFLPWNEVSRRYVDSEPEFFFPEHWRVKADNVKQGSSDVVTSAPLDTVEIIRNCLSLYQEMLDDNICPEQARMVLPQNTMTEWIWSGSLGAFADMCRLRLDSHTQQETREVAVQVAEHLKTFFPVSYAALLNSTL